MIPPQRISDWRSTALPGALVVLLSVLATLSIECSAARGGTMRYDLTELLGEHRFEGEKPFPELQLSRHGISSFDTQFINTIDTPFETPGVSKATLVINGNLLPGNARGGGIDLDQTEFVLQPRFRAFHGFSSFSNATNPAAQTGLIRINETFAGPFSSGLTVLPFGTIGTGGPLFTFSVIANIDPGPSTRYPPRHYSLPYIGMKNIGPKWPPHSGYLVVTPIIANITEAYVVLEGSSVVPEPSSGAMILLGMSVLLLNRRR